ncbi:hypothetical protein HDU67_004383, partial [Dinochytrium kinnereticum]
MAFCRRRRCWRFKGNQCTRQGYAYGARVIRRTWDTYGFVHTRRRHATIRGCLRERLDNLATARMRRQPQWGYSSLQFSHSSNFALSCRGVVDGRDLAFWEGWGCTLKGAKTRLVHLVRLVQRLFYERIWVPRCQATAEFWEEEARAEADWETFMDDLFGPPARTGGASEDPVGPTPRPARTASLRPRRYTSSQA